VPCLAHHNKTAPSPPTQKSAITLKNNASFPDGGKATVPVLVFAVAVGVVEADVVVAPAPPAPPVVVVAGDPPEPRVWELHTLNKLDWKELRITLLGQ
jgi:hypothetical protein